MNWLEILGVVIGLIYLYFEYRASVWLWIAGIIMPAIYIVVYYDAGLYADLGISIYYILASVYGWICWYRGRAGSTNREQKESRITHVPASYWWGISLSFVIIFIVIGLILQHFTDSTVPWADAFTTAMSIMAMWLLAKKYLEQWLVWIIADVGCAALYCYKDLWLTGGLYLLYAVIAVSGYLKWKKLMYGHGFDK